jgi:hypothetical protein
MLWPKVLGLIAVQDIRSLRLSVDTPGSGIDKDEHKDVKATVQRIHAAEFAKKSALKLATAQGSRTQQATDDEFFSRSWRECSSRSSKWPSPRQRVSYSRSLR